MAPAAVATIFRKGRGCGFDPKLDLAALHLPRLALMIAQAAQRYGMSLSATRRTMRLASRRRILRPLVPIRITRTACRAQRTLRRVFAGALLRRFPWSHLSVVLRPSCVAIPAARRLPGFGPGSGDHCHSLWPAVNSPPCGRRGASPGGTPEVWVGALLAAILARASSVHGRYRPSRAITTQLLSRGECCASPSRTTSVMREIIDRLRRQRLHERLRTLLGTGGSSACSGSQRSRFDAI